MKRTAHILKDATGLLGTALILGLALFMTCHAQAQDIYEIEQTFDQPFNNLEIDKGWDARLIQAPKGSPPPWCSRPAAPTSSRRATSPTLSKPSIWDPLATYG